MKEWKENRDDLDHSSAQEATPQLAVIAHVMG